MQNKKETDISKKIKLFYSRNPFPFSDNVSLGQLRQEYAWLAESFDQPLKGKNVLDAACGTGVISCSLALEAGKVTGVDFNYVSIKKAKMLAKKLKIKNAKFQYGDLLDWKMNEKFDHVFCIGALHHTGNPLQAFENLTRNVKRSGYITIGLYNLYTNIPYFIFQKLLNLLMPSQEQRIKFLKFIFPRRDGIRIADMYANPHKSFHTVSEVRKWFRNHDFVYIKNKSFSGFFLITGKKL